MEQPKIGLVLSTLNAMPHLKEAFSAIRATKYQNLKIIIQDGMSNDGTLEYIETQRNFFEIDLVSSLDNGVGQAYARALRRVSGCDFVTIISADERLQPDFFKTHLSYFRKNKDILVVYGSSMLLNPVDKTKQIFRPGSFTLEKIIKCETVPPISTCMFNAKELGNDMYYDETMTTCMDFEFWVRVAAKFPEDRFLRIPEILSIARMDQVSMSFNARSYLNFARDKVCGLKSNLTRFEILEALSESDTNELFIAIYCWAAEMVHSLEGANQDFVNIVSEAINFWGPSPQLLKLVSKSDELEIWLKEGAGGDITVNEQMDETFENTNSLVVDLKLGSICRHNGAVERLISNEKIELVGGAEDWSYSWLLEVKPLLNLSDKLIGATCYFEVDTGQMSVCVLNRDEIDQELKVSAHGSPKLLKLRFREFNQNPFLCVRNAGVAKSAGVLSKVVLHTVDAN